MTSTTCIVFAESCLNLAERFTPLVEEIRARRPGVRAVGVFACFERDTKRIDDKSLFCESYYISMPSAAVSLIRAIPHDLLIVFINHNATWYDAKLYDAARRAGGGTAFVLRNRISLRNFFATGIDDREAILPKLRPAVRLHAAIDLKTRLLASLVSVACCAGRVVRRMSLATRDKQRILFIKLDVLGDMIVTIPCLRALRAANPDAELTVLASSRGAAILEAQNQLHQPRLFDTLLVWDAPWHQNFPKILGVKALFELVRRLPSLWLKHYDLAIQPVHFGTGIVFALLTFAERVAALVDPGLPLAARVRHLLTDSVDLPADRVLHMQEWTKLVLQKLGIETDLTTPALLIDPGARIATQNYLRSQGVAPEKKLFLFHVGAGHPLRTWGVERFAELAGELVRRHDAVIVLTGGKGEQGAASEIQRLARVAVVNTAGLLDLNGLTALIGMADLMVTVDTGIMHLAAALDANLVAIYGAGLVASCRPLNANHLIVKEELGCSGCVDRCFVDGYPPCLAAVTVDRVLLAVERMLSTPPPREEVTASC